MTYNIVINPKLRTQENGGLQIFVASREAQVDSHSRK